MSEKKHYEPELGQACFGAPWGEHDGARWAGRALSTHTIAGGTDGRTALLALERNVRLCICQRKRQEGAEVKLPLKKEENEAWRCAMC